MPGHWYETEHDTFSVFRAYQDGYPSYDPAMATSFSELCDTATFEQVDDGEAIRRPWFAGFGPLLPTVDINFFAPFRNATTFHLMNWFHNSSPSKSLADIARLVNDVILAPDFDREDLRDFNAARESARMDEAPADPDSALFSSDRWYESTLTIKLPVEGHKGSEREAFSFAVPGLHHRKLMEVLRSAYEEVASRTFHTTPFKMFWQPDAKLPPEHIITELYNSDAMLHEHEKIKSQPHADGCTLETVVASIMLWSDSTHLASFGHAALWPIYLFIGNQSKYIRNKPTSFAAHHLAYIPKLPDTLQDFYKAKVGRPATASVLTHCKRELMHAIWALLLDDEFMEAYKNGVVIRFPDNILRRVFPRFFTYAADYPEKILLACIKFLGSCPCPRCLVLKKDIANLGSKRDRAQRNRTAREDTTQRRGLIESARRWIFEKGRSVASKATDELFNLTSMVPTRNAFSEHLFSFGFNFYTMFVPDFMHEFELGVWKATLMHLLRILFAAGGDKIQDLNKRYRQIPTFGRDTIRRFGSNVSDLSKLAARDFEDLLQCAIPAFEGLLPPAQDAVVMDLLFEMTTWLSFGKLRMHTETTLHFFDSCTTRLGQVLRRFRTDVCDEYDTRDLPKEAAARGRRTALLAKKGIVPKTPGKSGPQRHTFNMSTYKLHALGDYVSSIWRFGTTDNYSTQPGELEHRRVKRFYARSGKNNFTRGIAKQQQRERLLHKLREQNRLRAATELASLREGIPATDLNEEDLRPTVAFSEAETLPPCRPETHYQISVSRRHHWDISSWLHKNRADPAVKHDFLARLKDHILVRLLKVDPSTEPTFTVAQRNSVVIVNNLLYRHKVLRVNYTTYDLRRAQDSLNPRTHADVMLLSHEDDDGDVGMEQHPYWYARIIGIFHVMVQHLGRESTNRAVQRVDFLWVRWFGRDSHHKSGWAAKRLHRVGFFPGDEDFAFGFVDPNDVLRGIHLIPAFAHHRTSSLLPPSIARQKSENDEDWNWYYVNMFVDRDMFMRFRGGGVGHQTTRDATRCLARDQDVLDQRYVEFKSVREGTTFVNSEGRTSLWELDADVVMDDVTHWEDEDGIGSANSEHDRSEQPMDEDEASDRDVGEGIFVGGEGSDEEVGDWGGEGEDEDGEAGDEGGEAGDEGGEAGDEGGEAEDEGGEAEGKDEDEGGDSEDERDEYG
ncbi:hypothetical protein PAXINDRAFT_121100, partial [Paxillus involutus ATCC 200175]